MVTRSRVSFQGQQAEVGTGLGGASGWHICDGHAIDGQASDQVNTVGQAGAGDPGDRPAA